jgi:hypothetical protein
MRQLTENEVVQFYAAYRAKEATAFKLRNEVERLRQETNKIAVECGRAEKVARGCYMAAKRYAIERDFLLFVLVTLFFGVVFYLFYRALYDEAAMTSLWQSSSGLLFLRPHIPKI